MISALDILLLIFRSQPVNKLTRGDLLSNVVRDWTLAAFTAEPLVSRRIPADAEPEGLRLSAILVHPGIKRVIDFKFYGLNLQNHQILILK